MINRVNPISRTYRHIKRYTEIIGVLIKHGFGDIIAQTKIDKIIDLGNKITFGKSKHQNTQLTRNEHIRKAIEELGPTFIKLGQVLSNRPDLIPQDLLIELEKLQSDVPPFPENEARKLIEKELGKPINEVFRKFTSEALASASIAQVHQAELLTGESVVIKVQRPRIAKKIKVDLEIMYHLATLMEKHIQDMKLLSPVSIVEEFGITIKKELDFGMEASHIERFRRNFLNNKKIYIPKLYKDISTKKILTLEYIDGIKITDIEKLKASGNDPLKIATIGTNLILKQIFKYGFFHADPHPGNIFILNTNIICFLDFGMMGSLIPKYREYLSDMIIALVNKDARKITTVLLNFSVSPDNINMEELETKIAELLDHYIYLPISEIDISEVLENMLDIVLSNKLKMPSTLYLLAKAIITIEGVARKLEPDFDIIEHLKPYAKKLIKERLNPLKMVKDSYLTFTEFIRLFKEFPFEARKIIKQYEKGKAKIIIEHRGLERILHKLDHITNRMSFAIVLSSLIIGSSLLLHAAVPPLWNEVSLIGIIGYSIAGFIGFWLLISILRSRKK